MRLAMMLAVSALASDAAETTTPATRATGADASGAEPAVDYRLGSGDRIRLTVFGHDDLSGEFTISETGTVSLPLVGTLNFQGVALDDAERTVVEALQPDYLRNPRVSIEVVEYRPFYIIGEVNEPGAYSYVNGMTVNEAVALAGGFTYRARKSNVVVIRATDAGRDERSMPVTGTVQPGDVVKVLERMF